MIRKTLRPLQAKNPKFETRRMQARNKKKLVAPTGDEVSAAICNVLDKAVNAESPNAPKQMRLILTKQNPTWKIPERRVAKYLKRILKSRKDPSADAIDVNEDEISLAPSTSSKGSIFKRLRSSRKLKKSKETGEESVPQDIISLPIVEDIEERANSIHLPSNIQPTAKDTYIYADQNDEDEEKHKDGSYFCDGSNCTVM